MNEKIKELYKQALLESVDDAVSQKEKSLNDAVVVEKFAELIVKECAELAGCNAHVSSFALGDLIKEHFGVE